MMVPLHAAVRFHRCARTRCPNLVDQSKNVVTNTPAFGAVPAGDLRQPDPNFAAHQSLTQKALDILLGD